MMGFALHHLYGLRPQCSILIEGVLRRPPGAPPRVDLELQAPGLRWKVDSRGVQYSGLRVGGSEVVWLQQMSRPLPLQVEWLPAERFRLHLELAASQAPRRATLTFSGVPGQEARTVPFSLRPEGPKEGSLTGWCGFLDLPAVAVGTPSSPGSTPASPRVEEKEPLEVDMLETGRPITALSQTEELAAQARLHINTLPVRELLSRSRLIESQADSADRPLGRLLAAVARHRQRLLAQLGRSSDAGAVLSTDSARERSMSEE